MSEERILDKFGKEMAIVIRADYDKKGTNFVTPGEYLLQVGHHNRKAGDIAKAHRHKPKSIHGLFIPQEVFHIISGLVRVKLYKHQEEKEVIVRPKDTILINCGHSIEFIANTKMIEVLQGPYRGRENEKDFLEVGKRSKYQSSL